MNSSTIFIGKPIKITKIICYDEQLEEYLALLKRLAIQHDSLIDAVDLVNKCFSLQVSAYI